MGHTKVLLNKLLFGGLPAWLIIALLGGVSWLTAMLVAVGLMLVAYIVGDLGILPQTGNTVATIADAAIAYLYFWALNLLGLTINSAAVFATVVAVTLVEGLVFHPYLKRLVSLDAHGPRIGDRS